MVTQNVEKTSLPIFPFTAIVGQEEMKLALELKNNQALDAWPDALEKILISIKK